MIDVKKLFAERYPDFSQQHPWLSRGLIVFIRWLWKEKEFKQFHHNNLGAEGKQLIERGFEYIHFSLTVDANDRENVPTKGAVVVVANHPIGSLDGLGLLNLLLELRPDTKVVSNALLYSVPEMRKLMIPVDNMGEGASRQAIKDIQRHLQQGGALLLFPAGKVSRYYSGKLQDPVWQTGFIRLAQKSNTQIVPVYVDARNSWLFYLLSIVCFPLSTLWLVHELFRFRNKQIHAKIGRVMDLHAYPTYDAAQLTQLVRDAVYSLQRKEE